MVCKLCHKEGHEEEIRRYVLDPDYEEIGFDTRPLESITMGCINLPVNWEMVERGMKRAPLVRKP